MMAMILQRNQKVFENGHIHVYNIYNIYISFILFTNSNSLMDFTNRFRRVPVGIFDNIILLPMRRRKFVFLAFTSACH